MVRVPQALLQLSRLRELSTAAQKEAAAIARENKMRHVVVAAQAAAKWRSRNKVAPGDTVSAVQAPATTKPQKPKKSRVGLRMAALTNRTDNHDTM